jgi:hypothetical protein
MAYLRRLRVKATGFSFEGNSMSQFDTRGMTNLTQCHNG